MRRAVAHAFVDDLDRPALADKDVHHFARVLRLRPGEVVSVSDGRGGSRLCEWLGGSLRPLTDATWAASPFPRVTVGFALTKGEHPEWAVQKLTEAGVDKMVVVVTDRCVTRWAPASEGRHLERLREVARQAAMQSRRVWAPTVEGPLAFSGVVQDAGGRDHSDVALGVPGGAPLNLSTPTVLVGPEGGWSDSELAAIPSSRHIGLGPNVLRAETAALAAGLLLVALRTGLVLPVGPATGAPAGPRDCD
jgi:16S rRNA (uracil1498-N3)-methyltransferase